MAIKNLLDYIIGKRDGRVFTWGRVREFRGVDNWFGKAKREAMKTD